MQQKRCYDLLHFGFLSHFLSFAFCLDTLQNPTLITKAHFQIHKYNSPHPIQPKRVRQKYAGLFLEGNRTSYSAWAENSRFNRLREKSRGVKSATLFPFLSYHKSTKNYAYIFKYIQGRPYPQIANYTTLHKNRLWTKAPRVCLTQQYRPLE